MFGIMNILMSFLGVVIGIIFGALPGMTATMAIAVFLPLTYSLDRRSAFFWGFMWAVSAEVLCRPS